MSEQNNIEDELRGLDSPLADMSRIAPFSVPASYFEGLTKSLVTSASVEDFETRYRHIPLPFRAPLGYFDQLPKQALLSTKNSGSVIGTKPAGRKISLVPQVRWAAAAAIALMISVGGYIMFSGNNENQPEKMLSSISGNDISDYVKHSYGLDASKVINNNINNLNVDSKDIVEYLDETGWE